MTHTVQPESATNKVKWGNIFSLPKTNPPAPKQHIIMVPGVAITHQVMQMMADEVLQYPNLETSWGIYGFRYPDNSVIICGILRPNHTTPRTVGNTAFGDAEYVEQMRWLKANFQAMQDQGKAPKEASLEFLFKGHSHHTLGVRRYSSTDVHSIKDAVAMGMPVAIGPLANIDRLPHFQSVPTQEPGTIRITGHTSLSFHFYYLSQQLVESGQTEPVLVAPELIGNGNHPPVPPLSWKLTQPDLFYQQMNSLAAVGCQVKERWRLVGAPPYTIELEITKPTWQEPVTIRTRHNYPTTPSQIIAADGSPIIDKAIPRDNRYRPVPFGSIVNYLDQKGLIKHETVPS